MSFFPRRESRQLPQKNSGENGGTHGARSLFVERLVVSENVGKGA
jgi:hypothetical protein